MLQATTTPHSYPLSPGFREGLLGFLRVLASAALSSLRSSSIQSQSETRIENRFLQLISENDRVIKRICFAYSTTKEDFDDLRQDVCLNIWRGLPEFKGEASGSTWVFRVALNTCVSTIRKRYRTVKTESGEMQLLNAIADKDEDPAVKSRLEILHKAIECLNTTDKAIITLQLEEKSYDEIAEIMGMNRNTIATRLRRIRQKLSWAVKD